MRQVLFHIPFPHGLVLDALLVALFLVLAIPVWLLSGRTREKGLVFGGVMNPTIAILAVIIGLAIAAAHFFGDRLPERIPVYGFGLMLFLAFVLCTWLAGRRGQK